MKIVVDAMCAEYGGIRTYVEHLLARWHAVHPEDELHVIVPRGMDLPTADHVRHELRVRRPRMVGRPFAQTVHLKRLARKVGADAVIATAPTTTVRRPGAPMAVVILDLRHELRPEQFTWRTRLLRRISYGRTYSLAAQFLSISQRSLDDLHELHPRLRDVPATVTYLGADHVQSWPEPSRTGPAIAFAQHTNKNPQLVIAAWAELRDRGVVPPKLMMLGVAADLRESLAAEVDRLGLNDHVALAKFLPDDEFRAVVVAAELFVFPSDFEGFGLPIVEGMTMGKPVVIGPDPGTVEVAGGHADVMAGWSSADLADAIVRARARSADDLAAAREWASTFTWTQTVATTRDALTGLVTDT